MREYQPLKPVKPGTTEAMLRKTYFESAGPAGVAQRMGVKRSQAHAYADPNSPQRIAYDQIRSLVRAGAREPVHDLCALAGGHFVPGDAPGESVSALASRASREHGEAMARVVAALADGKVTAVEAAGIADEVQSQIRTLVAMQSQLLAVQS